jgi:uncharacterized protein (DUF2461 family)
MKFVVELDTLGTKTINFYNLRDLDIYQDKMWIDSNRVLVIDYILDGTIYFLERDV